MLHGQASPADTAGGEALAALLGDMDACAMEAEIIDTAAEEHAPARADSHHAAASADPVMETSIVPVRA